MCCGNLEGEYSEENGITGIKIQGTSTSVALDRFLHSRKKKSREDRKSRKQLGLNHGVNAIRHIEV